MKALKSFMIMELNGIPRISYRYNKIDNSGKLETKDGRGQVFVVDPELQSHVEAIKDFISKNELGEGE